VRLVIDDDPVDSSDTRLFHKTTYRDPYTRRRRRHPEADEVIMVNERGECTEVTTANLMVRRDGTWITPPLSSGCLPGVARAQLIEQGDIVEAVVLASDLAHVEGIAVVNSLRGWRDAQLLTVPVT
jgi:para-aminobenzoate synthetase/4-amino-4-deoxychorismate lyase